MSIFFVYHFIPLTLLQALDVGIFKSLKSHYNKEGKKYVTAHPGRVIMAEILASLIGKEWSLYYGRV